MEEGLRACGIPEGVFQVAVGRGSLGEDLIDQVDFLMFTGSTEIGRRVMERAAKTLTPVSLELGGKDPMIVLSDADVERAANAAVFWAMQNAGQTCISVERVYVEEPVYDDFVSRVAEKTAQLRQGVPSGFGSVEVGSFINPPQADIVEAHVKDAVGKGARVLAGGHRVHSEGSFFEPTVLADADHSMRVMTEETFGPTLPIMKVSDSEEAITLANDSPYGLQASVFTRDIARGEAVARRVQSGAVVVNDCGSNYSALEAPMGGWKSSGVGVRHGPEGIRKYTHRQTIVLTRFAPKKELYMFPYNRLVEQFALEADAVGAHARGEGQPEVCAGQPARHQAQLDQRLSQAGLREPPPPLADGLDVVQAPADARPKTEVRLGAPNELLPAQRQEGARKLAPHQRQVPRVGASRRICVNAVQLVRRDHVATEDHGLEIEPAARGEQAGDPGKETPVDVLLAARPVVLGRTEVLESSEAGHAVERSKGLAGDLAGVHQVYVEPVSPA
jgi:hypothetical protein